MLKIRVGNNHVVHNSLYDHITYSLIDQIDKACQDVAELFHADKNQCMDKITEVESMRESLLTILNDHTDNQYTHHDYNVRYQFILDVIDYASAQTVFYKLDILNNR